MKTYSHIINYKWTNALHDLNLNLILKCYVAKKYIQPWIMVMSLSSFTEGKFSAEASRIPEKHFLLSVKWHVDWQDRNNTVYRCNLCVHDL